MKKRILVDWVSFTTYVEEWSGDTWFNSWVEASQRAIAESVPSFGRLVERLPDAWGIGRGRSGYSVSHRNTGTTVFLNPKTPHALVEISGVGCAIATKEQLLMAILKEVDVTRIDIAVDIKCEVKPVEIVTNYMSGNKMRSKATVISDTGETVYIGSRKSDRYLRVYRYNQPHPRAAYLRFEFVCRKKYAKHIREMLASGEGVQTIVNGLAQAFQIEFPGLITGSHSIHMPGIRGNTSQNKTERWLLVQAVPALLKLHKEGHIENLESWIEQHVYSRMAKP